MKKLLSLVNLIILAGVMAACSSTPGTSSPPLGETARMVEGRVENYQGDTVELKAYRAGSLENTGIVGGGQINVDGSFSFEFNKTVNAGNVDHLSCPESSAYDPSAIPNVLVEFLAVGPSGEGESFDAVGSLMLATSDGLEKWEDETQIAWIYVENSTEIERICKDGISFDVQLNEGWNKIVVTYKNGEFASARTGTVTNDLSWYFVPAEEF